MSEVEPKQPWIERHWTKVAIPVVPSVLLPATVIYFTASPALYFASLGASSAFVASVGAYFRLRAHGRPDRSATDGLGKSLGFAATVLAFGAAAALLVMQVAYPDRMTALG